MQESVLLGGSGLPGLILLQLRDFFELLLKYFLLALIQGLELFLKAPFSSASLVRLFPCHPEFIANPVALRIDPFPLGRPESEIASSARANALRALFGTSPNATLPGEARATLARTDRFVPQADR